MHVIDGILAGKGPRFTPAEGEPTNASNLSFNAIVDDALAYRKSRVGISVSQVRYDNLANKAKIIKECAAAVETQLPVKETSCLNLVMGHTQKHDDMGRVYNGQVDDHMVKHYCDFVRAWLYHGEKAAHKLTQLWSLQDGKPYFEGKYQGVA